MAIGIDCDEVIFPLLPNHCIFLSKKYKKNIDWKSFSSYNFWEHYGITREQAIQDFIEFTATREFAETLPAEGSQKGITEIRKLDELYIVTSRAEDLKDKTQEWLDIYFSGMFSKLLFCNTFSDGERKKISKRKICRENGIFLLLEDHYDYALEVSEDIPVILFNKPWNGNKPDLDNIVRVHNWNQAIAAAKYFYRNKINLSSRF